MLIKLHCPAYAVSIVAYANFILRTRTLFERTDLGRQTHVGLRLFLLIFIGEIIPDG